MRSNFVYNIKARPTRYKGIQFRSRLEATWAAFFDDIQWKWQYEPVDLEGWVPDFVLFGGERPLYCEVKPFYLDGNWEKDPNISDLRDRLDERFCCADDVLLLGLGPAMCCEWCDDDWPPVLGIIRYAGGGDGHWTEGWSPARFTSRRGEKFPIGLVDGDRRYDRFGVTEYPFGIERHADSHLVLAWERACNRLQWRGRAAVSPFV